MLIGYDITYLSTKELHWESQVVEARNVTANKPSYAVVMGRVYRNS